MKSYVLIPLLVSAVYAQSSISTTNPLIPSGISSNCSSFMNKLDSDQTLLPCISPLVKATSAFAAGSNSTNTSPSAVNATLNGLCGSVPGCEQSLLRTKLTEFYGACTQELTANQNADVIRNYDVLYALYPLMGSVCSKGDDGNYCAIDLGTSISSLVSSSSPVSSGAVARALDIVKPHVGVLDKYLWSSIPSNSVVRRATVQQAYYPNITTFHDSNLLFLRLQPNLPSSALCVSCTRNVLSSYVDFESSIPYAPGMPSSPLMSGQSALYQAVQKTCGANFLSGSVQAAGGISSGVITSGASPNVAVSLQTLAAGLTAVLAGFCAMF